MCDLLNYVHLLVINSVIEEKAGVLKLVSTTKEGTYSVHAHLQSGERFPTYHILAIHAVKHFNTCTMEEDIAAVIIDNTGKLGLV